MPQACMSAIYVHLQWRLQTSNEDLLPLKSELRSGDGGRGGGRGGDGGRGGGGEESKHDGDIRWRLWHFMFYMLMNDVLCALRMCQSTVGPRRWEEGRLR